MPNEALRKLFSVRPPTIEEILSQEKARETNSVSTSSTPAVTSSKRKIPSIPSIHDTLRSTAFDGQENLVMHIAKKSKVVPDPKPIQPSQLHKRKESEYASTTSTIAVAEQSASKKLKPSSLRSGSISPKVERRHIDPKTGLSRPIVPTRPVVLDTSTIHTPVKTCTPSQSTAAAAPELCSPSLPANKITSATVPTVPIAASPSVATPTVKVNLLNLPVNNTTPTALTVSKKPSADTKPTLLSLAPVGNKSDIIDPRLRSKVSNVYAPKTLLALIPPYAPESMPSAVPYTGPKVTSHSTESMSTQPVSASTQPASASSQPAHGPVEPKASNNEKKVLSKKRQKKNKLAKRAAKKHNDYPKETKELDFDALLKYHEQASKASNKKQNQPAPKNQNVVNNTSIPSSAASKPINKAPAHSFGPSQTVNKAPGPSKPADKAPINPPGLFHATDKAPIHSDSPSKVANKAPTNSTGPSQTSKKATVNKNQKKFVPTVVCNYFLKGFCKQGDTCKFKHEGEPAPPPTLNTVCQFFKTGSCNQGDECKFSHNLKLEPCRFFHMQGTCEQGDVCPYSHEPLNADRLNRLRALTGPCRFYHFKGYCNSGDACLFNHAEASDEEKKVVESNILACRFFHIKKNCKQGDDCFYLHDEASAEQIRKLK